MAVTPIRPETGTGVVELWGPESPVLDPSPSSPALLSPQHCTVPPDSSAQAEL
jgi:hypothetical protein